MKNLTYMQWKNKMVVFNRIFHNFLQFSKVTTSAFTS